jgi:hypothetical protein
MGHILSAIGPNEASGVAFGHEKASACGANDGRWQR